MIKAIHVDHFRILQGASWVILFVLLAKIVGAVKEVAIAYQYGVSGVVDAYQVAYITVTWLPTTLVSALSVVLVPLFVRARIQSVDGESLFMKEIHGASLVLGLLLVLITMLAGAAYIDFVADNLPDETRSLAVQLTYWLSPVAAMTLVIGVLSAKLQSHGRQLNTLFECLPALVILVCIFLPVFSASSDALLWGTLLGFTINTLLLVVATAHTDRSGYKAVCQMRSPYWSELYKAVGIMALGQFVMSFVTPLDQYVAAQLGEGAIATLGYANRLLMLGISVGAMAIARGTLPVLSSAIAQRQSSHARSVAMKWSVMMLVAGVVVTVLGWFLAPYAVRLMFERGAFTATDTAAVTSCLQWGLLQVPGYFSAMVLVQLLASLKEYRYLALISCGNFLVKAIMTLLLAPYYGLAGIMLATALMYMFAFFAFWGRVFFTKL